MSAQLEDAWKEYERTGEICNSAEGLLTHCAALTEHLRLKEEENKQLHQDNEKLTGKIADMAPVVSQANQWRDEHLRTSKLLTQSNKDKSELVEALEVMVISYAEKDSYDYSPLPANEQDADMAMVMDLLEKHK